MTNIETTDEISKEDQGLTDGTSDSDKTANSASTLESRMNHELKNLNLNLEEVEELILCKVFNKLHPAFYHAWVADARALLEHAARTKKRRTKYLAKKPA